MFKRSASSRTQRSKGFVRAKQILQILVLLGVCFWLVYQVKYSHDKKKAILDEKDSEISDKEQDGRKSGRKELLPRVYDKQHNAAEEEDEDKVEDEDEHEEIEESNVHDDGKKEIDSEENNVKKANEEVDLEEEEEEIVKNDEPENHEKPRELEVEEEEEGLKELEDRDQEQHREEGEDHEEFIDEEKEKEEDDDGEEVKKDDTIVEDEDEDHDEISREAHEAREEHYKGDDASSAVTRDTEIEAVETKELNMSSSVHNNESTTVEIIEKNPESGNSNGSEDHDHATDVENTTELANSSPTDESELGNAAASDPELVESSLDHSEDTSLVGSDSNLSLPSNTTESVETNTQTDGVQTD